MHSLTSVGVLHDERAVFFSLVFIVIPVLPPIICCRLSAGRVYKVVLENEPILLTEPLAIHYLLLVGVIRSQNYADMNAKLLQIQQFPVVKRVPTISKHPFTNTRRCISVRSRHNFKRNNSQSCQLIQAFGENVPCLLAVQDGLQSVWLWRVSKCWRYYFPVVQRALNV